MNTLNHKMFLLVLIVSLLSSTNGVLLVQCVLLFPDAVADITFFLVDFEMGSIAVTIASREVDITSVLLTGEMFLM